MTGSALTTKLEAYLRARGRRREGTCLMCFVAFVLDEQDCDNTLRWAKLYRDTLAPHDKGLESRLKDIGGYCDCELFMNSYTLLESLLVFDPVTGEQAWPSPRPSCALVRPRSTQPCTLWQRHGEPW